MRHSTRTTLCVFGLTVEKYIYFPPQSSIGDNVFIPAPMQAGQIPPTLDFWSPRWSTRGLYIAPDLHGRSCSLAGAEMPAGWRVPGQHLPLVSVCTQQSNEPMCFPLSSHPTTPHPTPPHPTLPPDLGEGRLHSSCTCYSKSLDMTCKRAISGKMKVQAKLTHKVGIITEM